MSQTFSKPRQKQRLDFYLERIQGLCQEKIEQGLSERESKPLELIKQALFQLEQNEQARYASRLEELESLKSTMRNFVG